MQSKRFKHAFEPKKMNRELVDDPGLDNAACKGFQAVRLVRQGWDDRRKRLCRHAERTGSLIIHNKELCKKIYVGLLRPVRKLSVPETFIYLFPRARQTKRVEMVSIRLPQSST